MIVSKPQIVVELTAADRSRGSERRGSRQVLLRWFHSERAYFEAGRDVSGVEVELPRPFEETAFMDRGGWRQKPRIDDHPRSLGQRMWASLPGDLRAEILSGTPAHPRRVAVLSTGSGTDDVPWEWLVAKDGRPIASVENVRFIRLAPTRYPPPPLTVQLPLRVLILSTNPKDERLLDAGREVGVIGRRLFGNQDFDVHVLQEPRIEALRHELEWGPHVVHYVGHSGLDGDAGHLILHDAMSRTHWISAAELAPLLPTSVRLICLSTCVTAENYQTGGLAKFAHCPAEVPLPTAIANQYAIEPQGAEAFWATFYPALVDLNGDAVEAFHRARTACQNATPHTWNWASFSLVVRDAIGRPLRITRAQEVAERLFPAEIQAQWAARLANTLDMKMRSLHPEVQRAWEPAIVEETSRLDDLERVIAEREGGNDDV